MKYLSLLLSSLILTLGVSADSPPPTVVVETSMGSFTLELYPEKAPLTVENFLEYVRAGFYDGTIFHRVVPDFMVQGGGYTPELTEKPTRAPVRNEAANGLANERGTVAMARTSNPHSARAQFFINLVDNAYLNHTAPDMRGFGYTVFGRVIEGMDVVDAISEVPTTARGGQRNLPVESVVISKMTAVSVAPTPAP